MEEHFFNIAINLLRDKKYKELFNILLWGFAIIAPSFSVIFLYNKELFNELDTIKLLLLCILINIFIIIFNYHISFCGTLYKVYIQEEHYRIKEECEEESNEVESEFEKEITKFEGNVAEEMLQNIIWSVLIIWIISLIPIETKMKSIFSVITISGFYVVYLFGSMRTAKNKLEIEGIERNKMRSCCRFIVDEIIAIISIAILIISILISYNG